MRQGLTSMKAHVVSWCFHSSLLQVEIYTDSWLLVRDLVKGCEFEWLLDALLEDIRALCYLLIDVCVCKVNRVTVRLIGLPFAKPKY